MNTWWKQHISSPVINHFGRQKESRLFSKPPIFIGGCGRSGTTLLQAILSAHPRIHVFHKEVDAFTDWRRQEDGLKPYRIDRFYRRLLTSRIADSKTRWCIKRPYNIYYIPEILEYFVGDVRFIHMVRDPRAVCTSKHPSLSGQYWISVDRWIRDVGSGLLFQDRPQMLTIRYEDLVVKTGETIEEICDFLGEVCTPEILDWYSHATILKDRAWSERLKPIHSDSLYGWQSGEHKVRVDEITANETVLKMMDELGYQQVPNFNS